MPPPRQGAELSICLLLRRAIGVPEASLVLYFHSQVPRPRRPSGAFPRPHRSHLRMAHCPVAAALTPAASPRSCLFPCRRRGRSRLLRPPPVLPRSRLLSSLAPQRLPRNLSRPVPRSAPAPCTTCPSSLCCSPSRGAQGFRGIAVEGQGLDLAESPSHRVLTDGTFR